MSKKIPKNSVCPNCSSGKKYKHCCGKELPITANSMRYISSEKHLSNSKDKEIYEKLGYYAEDYIYGVQNVGKILYVLIDEAKIDDYYAVAGVLIEKEEVENNKSIQEQLTLLTEQYGIDHIHFNEILGRKNVLKGRRREFLKEYAFIVNKLNLKAFSVCMSKLEIEDYVHIKNITDEQCYMALTWRLMFNILVHTTYYYGNEHIIEMWRENDNITVEKRMLHQENIRGLLSSFPFANVSIYRHYIVFMKEDLLFSSLADFIAYLTSGVCSKIQQKKVSSTLIRDYEDLIITYADIFAGEKALDNPELTQLVEDARQRVINREMHQRKK